MTGALLPFEAESIPSRADISVTYTERIVPRVGLYTTDRGLKKRDWFSLPES